MKIRNGPNVTKGREPLGGGTTRGGAEKSVTAFLDSDPRDDGYVDEKNISAAVET